MNDNRKSEYPDGVVDPHILGQDRVDQNKEFAVKTFTVGLDRYVGSKKSIDLYGLLSGTLMADVLCVIDEMCEINPLLSREALGKAVASKLDHEVDTHNKPTRGNTRG